jgi:hypothetical protein
MKETGQAAEERVTADPRDVLQIVKAFLTAYSTSSKTNLGASIVYDRIPEAMYHCLNLDGSDEFHDTLRKECRGVLEQMRECVRQIKHDRHLPSITQQAFRS